jgi:hypothetical protein
VESGKWKADQNITISYLKILMHKNDLEVHFWVLGSLLPNGVVPLEAES